MASNGRTFTKPNVGASGRRRIVPIMGIDFIAGDIKRKGQPVSRDNEYPYGVNPPSIGGRTLKTSFVNFLHISSNAPLPEPTTSQQTGRQNFSTARKSAIATLANLSVYTQITREFWGSKEQGTTPVVREGVDPNDYATMTGWVMAVRMAQIAAGEQITDQTNTWFT